jgi:hypothetical protein
MKSVIPEDADLSSVSDLRSENHTRLLDLLAVTGGADMLWHPYFEAGELTCEGRFESTLVLLFPGMA